LEGPQIDAIPDRSAQPCGEECLLWNTAHFPALIPRGERGRGYLFHIANGTAIRRKRRQGVALVKVLGAEFRFCDASQNIAFDILRRCRSAGIVVLIEECFKKTVLR